MQPVTTDRRPALPDTHLLLTYVADLELEVDRLRKQGQFLRHEVRDGLRRIERLSAGPAAPAELAAAARDLDAVLRDLDDTPGYHPAHDQVVAVAVRPLVEQVFRWQRRLTGNADVTLRLELEVDHVEWFPARLRHILDNLFSNALRYRDPVKGEAWVLLGLRAADTAYEFRVSDNGMGLPVDDRRAFELLSRAAPVRAAGLGVGLPVVKLLVEGSGGTLEVRSEEGRGTDFVLTLPRYDIDDFLT
ncbi:MAG TPA: ATP-binding protein [Gemmataceae bacterium]|nr:ATP-binding protein [Gemmataceae bacterium]